MVGRILSLSLMAMVLRGAASQYHFIGWNDNTDGAGGISRSKSPQFCSESSQVENKLVPGLNPPSGDMKSFLEQQRRMWLGEPRPVVAGANPTGSGGVDHTHRGENGNGDGSAGPSAAADVPVQGDAGDPRPVAAGANHLGM